MAEIALRAGKLVLKTADLRLNRNAWRLVLLAFIVALLCAGPDLRQVTLTAIRDAYLQVAVFVAGTLAIVYLIESSFKTDIGLVLERTRVWQVPITAFLGALPGCGGAIIVMTQYTRGHVSFGGVVAVLISTMGDAAFLLLAREPKTGLLIFAMGFVLGSVFGWLVDAVHGRKFLRPEPGSAGEGPIGDAADDRRVGRWLSAAAGGRLLTSLNRVWLALLAPGVVLGLVVAFQVDADKWFGGFSALSFVSAPTAALGAAGGLLCLVMWAFAPAQNSHAGRMALAFSRRSVWARVVADTNFITAWVVFGFLAYELVTHFAGGGVEAFFHVWAPLVPLMAVVVGFVPGCGPQIVVTTLYLAGTVPLSAQFGNAISNDGDALFPAIALAPRAAFVATVYSAVPALILAYGYYFLFELR